ncbi:UNVERIFIED_CONTAM: phage head closure protein [Streptococcus canis]
MKIALLNQRVLFKKRVITQDDIGNETSSYTDLFSRWASVNQANSDEIFEVGQRKRKLQMVVTVRYDSEVASLDTTNTQLIFQGKPFNILSIDHVFFEKKMFKCRVEEEP